MHNIMLGTTTWTKFLLKFKLRFGSTHFEDHESELAKLTQRGTIEDFQAEFETLMNKKVGVLDTLLILLYIDGLKSNIRREIQVNRPTSLEETFALARIFEGKHLDSLVESRTIIQEGLRVNTVPASGLPPSRPKESG